MGNPTLTIAGQSGILIAGHIEPRGVTFHLDLAGGKTRMMGIMAYWRPRGGGGLRFTAGSFHSFNGKLIDRRGEARES